MTSLNLEGVISRNTFRGNTGYDGGAIKHYNSSPSMVGNMIVGNSATHYGGGIVWDGEKSGVQGKLVNNTIAGNTGSSGGCVYLTNASLIVENNIVAFNSYGISKNGTGTLTITNNDVYNPAGSNYNWSPAPAGDISSDPLFVGSGDYHLTTNSPCIDTGDDTQVAVGWLDIDSGQRRLDGDGDDTVQVDLGADEYEPDPPSAPVVTDEGQWATSTTTLRAWWTVESPGSIQEYQWAVGTSATPPTFIQWTSAGTTTTATYQGNLRSGTTYYFYVRARNYIGWGAIGVSDGVTAASPYVEIVSPDEDVIHKDDNVTSATIPLAVAAWDAQTDLTALQGAVQVSVVTGHNSNYGTWCDTIYDSTYQVWEYTGWDDAQTGNYTIWAKATDGTNTAYAHRNVTVANVNVVYVDPDGVNPDGESWGTAWNTIADGLAAASSGDEVWVSSTYYHECFTVPAGVALYGGFSPVDGEPHIRPTAKERAKAPTTVDGDGLGDCVIEVASGATQTTVIDRFTITHGSGRLVGGARYGGGIYAPNASPTISNNKIGYIAEDSTDYGNHLPGDNSRGAGIYCTGPAPVIVGNRIEGNAASSGATGGRGGGIYCYCETNNTGLVPVIANNYIHDNYAGAGGGIWASLPTLDITNNTLQSNACDSSEGVPTSGGGIYCDVGTISVKNNIVYQNTSGVYKNTAALDVGNNCVYDNCPSRGGCSQSYNYSWTPDPTGDDGNISADPKLGTKAKLSLESPCIDVGDDSVVETEWHDFYWNPRREDVPNIGQALVDMGAYEFPADSTKPDQPSVTDEGCTCSTSRLYAQWNTSDSESEIWQCFYAIGTSPANLALNWTSQGIVDDGPLASPRFSVSATGLSLTPSTTYYFYVVAYNRFGVASAVGTSSGVTVGCSSPTIEDALRCADGGTTVCTIPGLVVTAGTTQFGAGGVYHAYVQDTTYGRFYATYADRVVGGIWGLRIDFENATSQQCECDPGDIVSIRGRMATRDGEPVMVIDFLDANHSFAVTDTDDPTSPEEASFSSVGWGELTIKGMTRGGITRPDPPADHWNRGKLVNVYNSNWTEYYVTYSDNESKFFYLDDLSFMQAIGGEPLVFTDGNGLFGNGVCASGTRVDWSWMSSSFAGVEVGDGLKIKGISASTVLNGETVRTVRLREPGDVEFAPTITYPGIYPGTNGIVSIQTPTIEWTDAPSHSHVEVCIHTSDSPYNAEGQTSEPVSQVEQTSGNSCQWDSSTFQPDTDYYVFVRVGTEDAYSIVVWGPWSRRGHRFRYAEDRLIYPVDGSTVFDTTPPIIWKYDHDLEGDITLTARVCSGTDPEVYVWTSGDVVNSDRTSVTTALTPGQEYHLFIRRAGGSWSRNDYTFTVASGSANVTNATTGTVEYTYDDWGNLHTVTVGGTATTTYTYDARNQLAQMAPPGANGRLVAYEYTFAGQRTQMMTISDDPEFLHTTDYEYTDRGALAKVTDQLGGDTTYEYYDNGQVHQVTYPNSTYAHRTQMQVDSDPVVYYTYDTANKMLTAGSTTYAYDGAGNTFTSTTGGVTTYYSWNWRNMLIQHAVTGGTTTSFGYDGLSNRVSRTVGGTTTEFLLDVNEIAEDILSGGTVKSYVGPGMILEITGSARIAYHPDGIGSTRAMTGDGQVVSYAGVYDAYGNLLAGYPGAAPESGFAGQYRYCTDSTGLKHLRARYYESTAGRFVSRDPIQYRAGFNLYRYADGNPVMAVDPLGLMPWPNYAYKEVCIPIGKPEADPGGQVWIEDPPMVGIPALGPYSPPTGPPTLIGVATYCSPDFHQDFQCLIYQRTPMGAEIRFERQTRQVNVCKHACVWGDPITGWTPLIPPPYPGGLPGGAW